MKEMCICMATGPECQRIFQIRIEYHQNENLPLLLLFYVENSLHDTYLCIILQHMNTYLLFIVYKKVSKIV